MKNKVCPIFDEFPEVFDEKISSMKCLECRQRKYDSDDILTPMLETACREKILEKEKYMNHIKELYKKGYKYILKVTDPNNKSYLFADNIKIFKLFTRSIITSYKIKKTFVELFAYILYE